MRAIDTGLALLVTAIWGLNFSIIKLGLASFDPYLLAAIRFSLCALPAVFFIPKPQVAGPYWVGYGLLFGVVQWGAVYAGIHCGLSAGLASLVLQVAVFFTMAGGVVFFQEKVSTPMLLGTAIAFSGVALVVANADGRATLLGLCLVILGAIAWAAANLIVKRARPAHMFGFMVWSSLVAPLPLLALSYLFSGPQKMLQSLADIDGAAIFSIAFQVYPTTLFGYAIWNRLLKQYAVSTVAPMTLFVPVFGMLGSVLVFSEALPGYKWVAMACILLGLLINRFGGAWWQQLQNPLRA
ncbi:MAG: EamA family transporter [Pseudomonadota bacterium]